MKKLLYSALFLCIGSISHAQTQISNGDFENWSTVSNCGNGDSLDNFFSCENFVYYNDLLTNNAAFCPDTDSPLKSTDKQSGNYALKLGALHYAPGGEKTFYFYNFVTLGTAEVSGSGNDTEISSLGIPFTGRPTKLTGYYKFNAGVNTDTLDIVVGAFNDDDDDSLFYGEFKTSANQSTYKKFEIVLDYNTKKQGNPTILELGILVGNTDAGSINSSTVAYIDNLVFEYDEATTATINSTSVSPITVFAANKQINFSQHVSEVTVIDMVGSEKISQPNNTQTINANALNTGLYIVTYKYNESYSSKKLILE